MPLPGPERAAATLPGNSAQCDHSRENGGYSLHGLRALFDYYSLITFIEKATSSKVIPEAYNSFVKLGKMELSIGSNVTASRGWGKFPTYQLQMDGLLSIGSFSQSKVLRDDGIAIGGHGGFGAGGLPAARVLE